MDTKKSLNKYLSPMGAWAFAIGTAIGWGSLVVTANTYLEQAGPLGTVFGLIIGAAIMFVVALNYSYLMREFPSSGGAYTYSSELFGPDLGLLAAWFLSMTYLAILWANITSLPLFGRIFLGGFFQFGRMYSIFGYDVYLGEVLLSVTALLLFGFLCMKLAKQMSRVMIVLACVFSIGIVVCFLGAIFSGGGANASPLFVPDASALSQIVKIAVISPWAFIGFESISHASEEFSFDHKKIRRVMLIVVVSTMLLYLFVTVLSVTAYPERYDSWFSYIKDIDNLSGLEALPAFYAANTYLGSFGVGALMLSLLALVVTSLIGNMSALSRLFYSMAKDKALPARFANLNKRGTPQNAIMLVVGLSILIPLIGRTAIGWIVDVTTIGATLIYGLVSAAAVKLAKQKNDRKARIAGLIGVVFMIGFGAYILLPNLIKTGSLAKETYLLFIIWSVLGFIFFRITLAKDKENRYGKKIIVWIVMLALVLFVSLIWMRQSMIASNEQMVKNIQTYYEDPEKEMTGAEAEKYIKEQIAESAAQDTKTILVAIGMFGFALIIMLTNHSFMNKKNEESERLVNIDPLTGVKSKHAFLVAKRQFDAAITERIAKEFAVAVCDVNGLKVINDTQGHKAGDEYIRNAGKMICDIFQHSPVYRTGGDEFVVILSGRDFLIRKELILALHDRSVSNIGSGGVVISGGYSDYDPGKDVTFHDVFERADTLMYEEKQLLKSMGSISREDAETASVPAFKFDGESEIMRFKRFILIVEDEEINRIMLGNSLQETYDVIYASDGVEALEQIKTYKEELALVLLDLQMPRMNGMEVLKVMREEDEFKDIPVLVMTADQSAEIECLKLGATDFIPKPYPKWEVVQARVNRCIELSEKRSIIKTTERDSLTKLFHMEYFLRYVRMYDQRYTDYAMDAIVLNVNRFHVLNERYGKQYGDSVLFNIGKQVRSIARSVGGVAARRGADTFLIYCPHREDYDKILEQASEGLTDDDKSASNRVRLRMGVYASVDKTIEIERRFNYAMIGANSVKRNQYNKAIGIYDEKMREAELYRERLLEDFKNSLDNGHFSVYFQPKFDIRPEKPVLTSAEALVRWKHSELGMISPAVFIPLLEDNGLILELDKFVWSKTAETIRGWKDRFGYSVPVSVNVSRIDMLMPDMKRILKQILDNYNLDTNDLILEITESAYTGDSEQIISTAKDLRGMGFRIEMDDFGTGYSSLGMLTTLPIDALKLDMSFVRSAFVETRDVRMIELIIDIADYIHVPVVAEGVETEEQYKVLKAMGCDVVQGYYFSKPVPAEDFERFLIERSKEKAEITPKAKKTYINLSKALTGNFENIFYVDLVTNFYLEFKSNKEGDLEILPGGQDFFGEMKEKLLSDVCEKDQTTVRNALGKNNLIRWIEKEETVTLPFGKLKDGKRTPYILQTIRTRSSDDHHVVIGVKPE